MFTIPNLQDAAYGPQARPSATDIAILIAGHAWYGVMTGCEVTAQAPADMTVHVEAGTALFNGGSVAVAADDVTIQDAGDNPRHDLVVVDDAGLAGSVLGDEHPTNPVLPDLPVGYAALAAVYVSPSTSSITSTEITDKRVFLPDPAALGAEPAGIWVPAQAMASLTTGSPASYGAAPDGMPTIGLSASADQYVLHAQRMPDDYAGGDVSVYIYFNANGVVAGSVVRWRVQWSVIELGDVVSEVGTAIDHDHTIVNENFGILAVTAAQTFTPAGLGAGDILRLNVARLGAHANDDYAAICHLVGICIKYDV